MKKYSWVVVRERLSDGSFAYNVLNLKDKNIVLHATGEQEAGEICRCLYANTVD